MMRADFFGLYKISWNVSALSRKYSGKLVTEYTLDTKQKKPEFPLIETNLPVNRQVLSFFSKWKLSWLTKTQHSFVDLTSILRAATRLQIRSAFDEQHPPKFLI